MRKTKKNLGLIIRNYIDIIAAIVAISISILHLSGLIDKIAFLQGLNNRLISILLFILSLVLISSVVDRNYSLEKINKSLMKITEFQTLGIQYLENSTIVVNELNNLIKRAEDYIITIGAKSTAKEYLNLISKKVITEEIAYYRLILGDHITHDLHLHLHEIIDKTCVKVAWNKSEKYNNFTGSEKEIILALPSSRPKDFTGIKIPGEINASRYNRYFMDIFSSSMKIFTKKSIESLCEECGKNITRNISLIEKILKEEASIYEKFS